MSEFRLDDAGLFLDRQLEYIRPQIFEVAYADIKYPTITSCDCRSRSWSQTFTYRIMDATGDFKLISDACR